jgi:mono/diheme cytochrome c family protein
MLIVLGLLAVAGAAGCGTTRLADGGTGKSLFVSLGCGACHTLAAAGAHGTAGTNLDADRPGYALSVDRIANGSGSMPSFRKRLTPRQIRVLAAYVVQATR